MPSSAAQESIPEVCQWCFFNAVGDQDLTADQEADAFVEYACRLRAGTWKRVPGDEWIPYGDGDGEIAMTADEWRALGSRGEFAVLAADIKLNGLLEQVTRETTDGDETTQ